MSSSISIDSLAQGAPDYMKAVKELTDREDIAKFFASHVEYFNQRLDRRKKEDKRQTPREDRRQANIPQYSAILSATGSIKDSFAYVLSDPKRVLIWEEVMNNYISQFK